MSNVYLHMLFERIELPSNLQIEAKWEKILSRQLCSMNTTKSKNYVRMMRLFRSSFARTLLLAGLFFMPLHSQAQTYTYDVSGRVTKASYVNGTAIKYKYDAAGNVKKIKVNPAVTASITAEGPNGNTAKFRLERSGDLSQALTVSLTAEGDAVNGQDYSSLPASVTFPAHEASVSISVTLRNDRPTSAAKKLVVSLADSDDYDLDEHSSATVTLPEKK